MTLAEQLEDIYHQHRDLTPRLLVDLARDPRHPLHDRFEWDDAQAGEKYRQAQAAQLIRSVRVVEPVGDQGQVRVRAWHSVARPEGNRYLPAEEIKQDPFLSRLVLQAAEREWRALHQKYAHLAEFLDVVRRDVAS